MPTESDTDGIDHGRGTFVVVGCGAAKADERREARNLYTSNYFQIKRQFAEAATNWIPDATHRGNGWMILSAKHLIWPPRLELEPYNRTIEDLDEDDRDAWAKRINAALIDWLRSPFRADEPEDSPCKNLIVLAGQKYIEPLLERDAFTAGEKHNYGVPTVPQFPLQESDLGGIGEQMAWLKEMIDVVDSTPTERAELEAFGGGYERSRAMWQLDRNPMNVEETEQAELSTFEDIDERYVATEQQSLSVTAADGGKRSPTDSAAAIDGGESP